MYNKFVINLERKLADFKSEPVDVNTLFNHISIDNTKTRKKQ